MMKKAFSKKNLWEKTPLLLKGTIGKGLSIFPLDWLLGRKFKCNYKFLKESQYWPIEKLRQYQIDKLREILSLAYQKTRLYHLLFESVGFHPDDFKSLEDLQKLPTIDKQTVINNISNMCTLTPEKSNVDYVSTGGTSGTPLHFYINADRSSIEYAYLTKSWQRAGYELGMPMAVLRGRIVKPDKNGLYHEYDPILRHHYYSTFHMTNENLSRYLDHIRSIGPCVLQAYPSSADSFASFILKTKKTEINNIKAVLLESENVYPDQVCNIEKAFGARAFSCYGHSEKLILATQCEKSDNYHVWPTYGYFELLDKQGKAIKEPGQEGEIVGTGFINTVMPFIRYRTGDYAIYAGDYCKECNRQHVLINNIKGRWPQGGLVAMDGSTISMTALNVHDDTLNNIREYQFYQSVPGKATLFVVPMFPLYQNEKDRILRNINKRLQGQVILELEVKSELLKTSRGKQPRVFKTF